MMPESKSETSRPVQKTTSWERLQNLQEIHFSGDTKQSNDSHPLSSKAGLGALAAILLLGAAALGRDHKGNNSLTPAFTFRCSTDDSGQKYEEVEVINTIQILGLHEGSLEQLDEKGNLQGGTNYSPDLKGAQDNLKTDFYVTKYPNGATARVKAGISSPSNPKQYPILGSIQVDPKNDC
jgi:hypothetical protein